MRLIEFLLQTELAVVTADELRSFWRKVSPRLAEWDHTVDRAIVGGFLGDRVAGAFAAGYQGALCRLDDSLPPAGLASFCATEAGGAHPKAIGTTLTEGDDGAVVNGSKRWSTCAPVADTLLVVASRGVDDSGKNRLAVIRVPTDHPSVAITPMDPTPFAPEIPHAETVLQSVCLPLDHVLPGDGYSDYVKPFRTIEDLHVHAAVLGYLAGVGRRSSWPSQTMEKLIAALISLRSLSEEDPKSPAVHIATAGALAAASSAVQETLPVWDAVDDAEKERWQRDAALTQVAAKARELRRDRAWKVVGGGAPPKS